MKQIQKKRPRSKTAAFIAVVVVMLVALSLYYVAAIRNSDNRPRSVETPSVISVLPQR